MYAALSVVIAAIAVAVVLGVVNTNNPVASGPLPIATVGQPGASTAACHKLMAALPEDLGSLKRRTLQGGGDGIAAWGDPAVILRCGLETPAELTCSAFLQVVNNVSWLKLDDIDQTTYLAADRTVRVAVTIPDAVVKGGLQQLSDVVAAALPARKPCTPAGQLLPTDTT